MVYVPAGEFVMGSASDDAEAENDEKPQHRVMLDAYWIDKTEVTNDQYRKCVESTSCAIPIGINIDYSDASKGKHPVVYMSWDDAMAYCEWAGRRLPSEAEWEMAARGTDRRKYPWGNTTPDTMLANFGNNVGGTSAVGSYPAGASPYGALDMAGNVWEWLNDWHGSGYYSNSPVANPPGEEESAVGRVLRGGSWRDESGRVRSANRGWNYPYRRDDDNGFRCARSL